MGPIRQLSCWLCCAGALAAQQRLAPLASGHLPPARTAVTVLTAADLDGDGDPDLLVGRHLESSEAWRNDGSGAFTPITGVGSLARSEATTAFAVGDVDGNGTPDLVWGTAGGRLLLLLSHNGLLLEAPAGHMPAAAAFTSSLALADADGDGDLDIVAGASGNTGGDRLLRNDGSGRFTEVGGALPGGGLNSSTAAIVPLDCDGDGDLDLLMVDLNGSSRLLRNGGAGLFQAGPALPSLGGSHSTAAAGDVDGDGDLDLVIGRGLSSNPLLRQDLLLLNDGSGVFTDVTASRMPAVDNRTRTLHLLDVDGDGDLDLLAGHSAVLPFGSRLGFTLLLGDGTGTFTDASATLPQNDLVAGAVAVQDVNGDGDPDLVFADHLAEEQHLYWNDRGRFRHATAPAVPLRRSFTEGVAAGDLDGDGLPDLVAGGWNFPILGGRTALLWNDGTGQFAEAATAPVFPFGFYASVAMGDVDGDGDLDLVFGLEQGQNRLYRNDGNRVFTDVTATALPVGFDTTRVVRLVDVDGDGDLDLIAGNVGQTTLALNDGTGRFTDASSQLPAGFGAVRDLAVGDVDGDGDPDLVLGLQGGGNRLWRNQGNAVFVDASQAMPPEAQDTEAVALADLDGDGDLDLIVGNTGRFGADPRSWLHRNDGSGSFVGSAIPLGSVDVQAIAVGDLEGDGDIDFVLGGLDAPLRLFEAVGGGSFVSVAASMPALLQRTRRLALADLDGDGDLDLFAGDEGVDQVLFGLHRHLHADRLAIPGGSLRLTVHAQDAPPSAPPFALLLAGFPAAPTASSFGPVRLAPGLVALDLLQFPGAQTRAAFPLAVPANPVLLGLDVGFQALVAHGALPAQWRLTGLVVRRVLR